MILIEDQDLNVSKLLRLSKGERREKVDAMLLLHFGPFFSRCCLGRL